MKTVPDDPRAKMFFDQWEKDTHEGITLRALHNRLTGHADRTEQEFRKHSSVMSSLKERIAAVEQNDKRDAEDRVTGTGRHQTPSGLNIPTPVQPLAVPFMVQPPPAIHVHGGQGGSVGGEYIGAGAQVAQGRAQQTVGLAPAAHPRTSSKRPISLSLGLGGLLKGPVLRYGLTVVAAVGATLGIHTVSTPAAAPPRVVYLPAPVESPDPVPTSAPLPSASSVAFAPSSNVPDAGPPRRWLAPPPAAH